MYHPNIEIEPFVFLYLKAGNDQVYQNHPCNKVLSS